MCGGGLRRPPTPVSLNRQPCCFWVVLVRSRSYPKCQPGEVLTTSGSLLGLPSQATADPGSPATETCRAMVGSPGSGRFFQGCEGESVPGVSQLAVSGGHWRPLACGRLTVVSACVRSVFLSMRTPVTLDRGPPYSSVTSSSLLAASARTLFLNKATF